MVLFSSWIPGIRVFFLFFLCFFPVFRCKSWFFTRWSCFLPGFPEFWKITFFLSSFPVFRCPGFLEFVFFFSFFCVVFPVFRCKSWFFTRWSCFLPGFLEFVFFFSFFCVVFPVFRCKSWFFTRWSCFLPGFPEFWKITFFLSSFPVFRCPGFLEFVFFFSFFVLFFLFSDVKVDFSHGGPVFFLDSWNSCFFSLFFCVFFLFLLRLFSVFFKLVLSDFPYERFF